MQNNTYSEDEVPYFSSDSKKQQKPLKIWLIYKTGITTFSKTLLTKKKPKQTIVNLFTFLDPTSYIIFERKLDCLKVFACIQPVLIIGSICICEFTGWLTFICNSKSVLSFMSLVHRWHHPTCKLPAEVEQGNSPPFYFSSHCKQGSFSWSI